MGIERRAHLVKAGSQSVHKTLLLPLWLRYVEVGEDAMDVNTSSLARGSGAEHTDDGDLLDVVATEVGDQGVQTNYWLSQVMISHHTPH